MNLKQPGAELNTDHGQQSWYGVTEIASIARNAEWGQTPNRCKIKDSCEVCCFVLWSYDQFCLLRFGFIFYYDNTPPDPNPYFMTGHLVPWQRAAGANEDAAGSSSCAAQFTHTPLMLSSTPSPGTFASCRREAAGDGSMLNMQTSLKSTNIDQHTHTLSMNLISINMQSVKFWSLSNTQALLKIKVLHDNIEEQFLAVWFIKEPLMLCLMLVEKSRLDYKKVRNVSLTTAFLETSGTSTL